MDPFIKFVGSSKDETLVDFFSKKKYESVSNLITKQNANIVITTRKNTLLHKSCEFGLEDLVDKLLDEDALVNVKNSSKWTPLLISLYHGHIHIAQKLLNKGADFNSVAGGNQNILTVSCKGVQLNSIKFVLDFITTNKLKLVDFLVEGMLDNLACMLSSKELTYKEANILQLECLKEMFKYQELCNIVKANNHSLLKIVFRWLKINVLHKSIKKDASSYDILLKKLRRISMFYSFCGDTKIRTVLEEDAEFDNSFIASTFKDLEELQTKRDVVTQKYKSTIEKFLQNEYTVIPNDISHIISSYIAESNNTYNNTRRKSKNKQGKFKPK